MAGLEGVHCRGGGGGGGGGEEEGLGMRLQEWKGESIGAKFLWGLKFAGT